VKRDREAETPYMSESTGIQLTLSGNPSLPPEVRPNNFKHLALLVKSLREGKKFT